MQPITTGESQVASAEYTRPRVTRNRPRTLSVTPGTSSGRGALSRDSMTPTTEMVMASVPIGTLTQKIDDQEKTASSSPPMTLPPATASPLTAAHKPIGPLLASGGYASEIKARVSDDMTAPPIPWITRNEISIAPDVESAHPTEASMKTANPATKMRLRPKRSPSAPPDGISAARTSAYEL